MLERRRQGLDWSRHGKRWRDDVKDWTGLNMESPGETTSGIGLVWTWKALKRQRQGLDWSQHGKRWRDDVKDWTGLNMETARETTSMTYVRDWTDLNMKSAGETTSRIGLVSTLKTLERRRQGLDRPQQR